MKRWLRPLLIAGALAVIGTVSFFAWPAPLAAVEASADQPKGAALVERGRYLATAADCVACHSTPGRRAFAGGVAFPLPFGTIYSSNITPDRRYGIGGWSDAQFVRAMRHGVDADGRDLYPAFPYTEYGRMSTDDLLAIRAFLATLAPVAQAAPANGLSFPFNQRYLMRAWKLLNGAADPITPDPRRTAEWNRGAYLVEGAGHCGECHTPRNLMFQQKSGRMLAGAVADGWTAYNITADPVAGVGGWSVDEIATYLKTGTTPGHGAAAGPMAEAVTHSLRYLSDADLRSIAVYLRSVPPQRSTGDVSIDRNPPSLAASTRFAPSTAPGAGDAAGQKLFWGGCAGCHAWNGEGVSSRYAALRGAATVNDPAATNLVRIILKGSAIETADGRQAMPSFGHAYSDAQIAALAKFVIGHFGGKAATVTASDVKKARHAGS